MDWCLVYIYFSSFLYPDYRIFACIIFIRVDSCFEVLNLWKMLTIIRTAFSVTCLLMCAWNCVSCEGVRARRDAHLMVIRKMSLRRTSGVCQYKYIYRYINIYIFAYMQIFSMRISCSGIVLFLAIKSSVLIDSRSVSLNSVLYSVFYLCHFNISAFLPLLRVGFVLGIYIYIFFLCSRFGVWLAKAY